MRLRAQSLLRKYSVATNFPELQAKAPPSAAKIVAILCDEISQEGLPAVRKKILIMEIHRDTQRRSNALNWTADHKTVPESFACLHYY